MTVLFYYKSPKVCNVNMQTGVLKFLLASNFGNLTFKSNTFKP